MALILRRKFKIKEQLLLMILPFIAIPIILVLSIRIYLYNFIKDGKNEINPSIIHQNAKIINDDFTDGIISNYGFFELKGSLLFKEGIVFVLDINNKVLYSNLESKRLTEKLYFDEKKILTSSEIANVINGEYEESKFYSIINDCFVFNYEIQNKKYQGYLLNTTLVRKMPNRIKLLYFYPRSNFITPIYPIIFFIIIISLIVFIIVLFIIYRLGATFIYPLNNLEYIIKKASQGYMNFDIVSESSNEFGQLYNNFNQMMKFNKSILIDIANSSNNLSGFYKSMERLMDKFEEKLKDQNVLTTENTKIIEGFDELINRNIQHIQNLKGIIESTQIQSDDSTELINEMINDINNIAQTGQQINYVAELLNKISEKTRLLSVNSAIEASRAGEVGKGFGVVATEIRKLAVLAKDSAKEIAELVKVNDSKIISGINKINEVLGSLKNTNSSIKMINQIVDQIDTTTQDEKKNNQSIISTGNNIADETASNLESLDSILKIRNLFKMDLGKIRDSIKKIFFDTREKVIVRDVKLYSEDNKEKPEKIKIKGETKKEQLRRNPNLIKNLRKVKARKSSKLNTVRAVTLYKPKKSILDKFRK